MSSDGSAADLERWEALRSSGFVRLVAAGDRLFDQGDEADGAYVVLTGSCAVVEQGDRIALLVPGDLFGEIGALGGGVRTATVVAVEDAELLFLSLDDLRQGFSSSPDLFWLSLRLIVGRLREVAARQLAYRDEHKALREVQRSLLPSPDTLASLVGLSVTASWEPCTFASGDYFDVIPLQDGRHLIAVGDVMGHGAEASLMMGIARAQIRELSRSFRRTDELMLRLDGYLRDNAPPRQGMSLVVAAFDPADRVLEYSVAGHPFPLVRRGGTVSDLPGRPGILLALPFMVGKGYERHETRLEAGDQLLMFTDGLLEVTTDGDGSQLGRGGLADLFDRLATAPADELLSALVAEVASVDAAGVADDDRTAVLVVIH